MNRQIFTIIPLGQVNKFKNPNGYFSTLNRV